MPTKSFLKGLGTGAINVSHQGLGPMGTKAMSLSLVVSYIKVSKGAKIRNRYNQVPHLTQDTNGKVTHSQLYTTNESQEVSTFPSR